MTKQFEAEPTSAGHVPSLTGFQRIDQSPRGGPTGEPTHLAPPAGHFYDVAQTVKGVFADHSDKLLAVIALLGFTFVFYAGNLSSWQDFWRYVSFLPIVLVFYTALSIGKAIGNWLRRKR